MDVNDNSEGFDRISGLSDMDVDDNNEGFDRISGLPDPVLHYIMSFLPSLDVTRISCLSKYFFSLWRSFPIISFHQKFFGKTSRWVSLKENDIIIDKFLDFILISLIRRDVDSVLAKFQVKATLPFIVSDHRLDQAIGFALENNVKELDLDVLEKNLAELAEYVLPKDFASKTINILKLKGFVLDIEYCLIPACPSIRYLCLRECSLNGDTNLSSLELERINLDTCDGLNSLKIEAPNLRYFSYNWKRGAGRDRLNRLKIEAPSLESLDYSNRGIHPCSCQFDIVACQSIKTLLLVNANLTDEWVRYDLPKLPQLEILSIKRCNGLKFVRFYNYNKHLKRFYLGICSNLETVDIIAPALESFDYDGVDKPCTVNFTQCHSLKSLTLGKAKIGNKWVENLNFEFPNLEHLELTKCNDLESVELFHQRLQGFRLLDCNKLTEVNVDAPQLHTFEYGKKVIWFGLMNCPRLRNSTLSLDSNNAQMNLWFYELRNMLGFFSYCESLTLICNSAKDLIFPEHLREILPPPLYDIEHLTIQTHSETKIDAVIVDGLLWLSHPETICFASSSRQKVIEFHYQEKRDEMDPYGLESVCCCCKVRPIKCWRYYLKNVEFQNFEDSDDKDGLRQYFCTNGKILEEVSYNSH